LNSKKEGCAGGPFLFEHFNKRIATFSDIQLSIHCKKKGGEIPLKQELYEKLAAYIIENQDKFYRLAFSYVKNQEDALDAVQNSVCKALEHYESLRNENAIKTWFYRIVINESIALLNAKKRLVLADDDQHWEIPYEEAGFQIHDDLYDEINQLEKDVQNIIKLRFYEELSLNEIARVLKMNLNTVKAKLYRGLKTLKVKIGEEEAI
jgi:RNA polymerase sigma-70 factor (ECF subfamily)